MDLELKKEYEKYQVIEGFFQDRKIEKESKFQSAHSLRQMRINKSREEEIKPKFEFDRYDDYYFDKYDIESILLNIIYFFIFCLGGIAVFLFLFFLFVLASVVL